MSFINEFMKISDHYRITTYTLECRTSDKHRGEICAKIGRSVKTLNINVNGINIHNEDLRWINPSIICIIPKYHLISRKS